MEFHLYLREFYVHGRLTVFSDGDLFDSLAEVLVAELLTPDCRHLRVVVTLFSSSVRIKIFVRKRTQKSKTKFQSHFDPDTSTAVIDATEHSQYGVFSCGGLSCSTLKILVL